MAPAARGGGTGRGAAGARLTEEREGAGRALREVQEAMADVKEAAALAASAGEGAPELYALQEALEAERTQLRRQLEKLKLESELRASAEADAAEAREELLVAQAQAQAAEARSRKAVELCREDRRKVAEAAEEAEKWARMEMERCKADGEEAVRNAKAQASDAIAEIRASAEEEARRCFADELAKAQAEAANAEAEVEDLRLELERVAASSAEQLAEARRVAQSGERETFMMQEQLENIVQDWEDKLRTEVEKAKMEAKVHHIPKIDGLAAQMEERVKEVEGLKEALELAKRGAEDSALDATSLADGLRMELIQSKMNEEMAARKAAEVLASSLRQSSEDAETIANLRAKLREARAHPVKLPCTSASKTFDDRAACNAPKEPAAAAARKPEPRDSTVLSPPRVPGMIGPGKIPEAAYGMSSAMRVPRTESAPVLAAELEGRECLPGPTSDPLGGIGDSSERKKKSEHIAAEMAAGIPETRRAEGSGNTSQHKSRPPSEPTARPPSGKRRVGGRSTILSGNAQSGLGGAAREGSAGLGSVRSRPSSASRSKPTSRPSSASLKLGPYHTVVKPSRPSSRPKEQTSPAEGASDVNGGGGRQAASNKVGGCPVAGSPSAVPASRILRAFGSPEHLPHACRRTTNCAPEEMKQMPTSPPFMLF